MFDLSLSKLLVLAVLALVVFGPNELPKIAAQAGRALRDLRRIAEGAKADLKEGLGPEFQDFDFEDLNPRRFVQKHLLDEPVPTPAPAGTRLSGAGMDGAAAGGIATMGSASAASGARPVLPEGEDPPFDVEAT
ncbi:sec-independent translocase [Trebonia sp.]|uniref:sec-independent translocase n=1 Tax=Trebonia sp. TaxID=2767075 RepID=UPI00262A4F85|nr:sec-independent translocase [Trebonia sp.]